MYGLLKIQRGNCAPWFQVVNLAWATVPWDAEILCRDENYIILKVTKEWCIQEARQGREVTSGSFEDLNINYPALADGVCLTLHPYLEAYTGEDEQQGRVVIYVDES